LVAVVTIEKEEAEVSASSAGKRMIRPFSISYDDHPDWTCRAFATYEEAFEAAGQRARSGDGPVCVWERTVVLCRRTLLHGTVLETMSWGTLDTGRNEARSKSTQRR